MESRPGEEKLIRFPGPRSRRVTRSDQRSLMEAVYGAGSLPIAADDWVAKAMATRLSIFGFVTLEEIQSDGTLRRLRPSEAVRALRACAWRVSKPSSRCARDTLPHPGAELSARPA
jgi:hypothetical protein